MLLPGSKPRSDTGDACGECWRSRDTRPASGIRFSKLEVGSDKVENGVYEQSVVHRLSSSNKVSLLDIARERVDVLCQRECTCFLMSILEEIKVSLRVMLEGNGGSQQRDEFMIFAETGTERSCIRVFSLSQTSLIEDFHLQEVQEYSVPKPAASGGVHICRACNQTSELLGWVKDVFQHCAPTWDSGIVAERTLISLREGVGEQNCLQSHFDVLPSIVRLKEAEADMFQTKADEARREAERIQRIALSKYEKSEEEYACRYLKLRLSEAEAERQYLFEKMKLQDNPRATKSNNSIEDPTQVLLSKVHEILKNV
nr:OBERON-like protein [Ipomoea batatas]